MRSILLFCLLLCSCGGVEAPPKKELSKNEPATTKDTQRAPASDKPEILFARPDIDSPLAASGSPLERGPVISITKTEILVDNRVVVSNKDAQADLPALVASLGVLKENKLALGGKFEGRYILYVDKETPFSLVWRVVSRAASVGFDSPMYVVRSPDTNDLSAVLLEKEASHKSFSVTMSAEGFSLFIEEGVSTKIPMRGGEYDYDTLKGELTKQTTKGPLRISAAPTTSYDKLLKTIDIATQAGYLIALDLAE